MHPQLDLHLHPKCRDIISQLRECHAKSAVGKLMGNCNDIKVKMDDCLYQEFLEWKATNRAKGQKLADRVAQRKREFQEALEREREQAAASTAESATAN
eukprot:m.130814 g.130814  ORF g.130814 m.130814 type:complete len:99 (-) comp16802_c0_seq3:32-328(-)